MPDIAFAPQLVIAPRRQATSSCGGPARTVRISGGGSADFGPAYAFGGISAGVDTSPHGCVRCHCTRATGQETDRRCCLARPIRCSPNRADILMEFTAVWRRPSLKSVRRRPYPGVRGGISGSPGCIEKQHFLQDESALCRAVFTGPASKPWKVMPSVLGRCRFRSHAPSYP